MEPIAHIETPYKEKFGVPRQAGLVDCPARIVFEPRYRVAEAVRGLEEFDYVWLIWQFHIVSDAQSPESSDPSTLTVHWHPTVRPPRLGGNKRVGVFATRSPFRPNAVGLSSVKLLRVEHDPALGPVLYVEGADMVDGTPIYDIKPYIAYADSHPEARSGFAQEAPGRLLAVVDNDAWLQRVPADERKAMEESLLQDPRPHYQHDDQRRYTMRFGRYEVAFRVVDRRVEVLALSVKKS